MRYDYLELAKILSDTRRNLKISKRKLAYLVGVSDTEISRIENGNRQVPNILTTIKICYVLKLNPIFVLLKTNFFTIEMLEDIIHNPSIYQDQNSQKKYEKEERFLEELANIFEDFLSDSKKINSNNCKSCKYYCSYCGNCSYEK